MEIVSQNTRRTALYTPHDKRCIAIALKYGSPAEMVLKWAPSKVIAINRARKESAEVPTLIMMIRTYSQEVMESLLQAHVSSTIASVGLGDKFSIGDCATIAKMICESDKMRLLNMAYLLSFFARFQLGEIEIFGSTPYAFLNAMVKYCDKAHNEQQIICEEHQRKLEKEKVTTQDEKTMSFDEYCLSKGIDPNTHPLKKLLGYNNGNSKN